MGMAPAVSGIDTPGGVTGGPSKIINFEQNNQINNNTDQDAIMEKTGFQLRNL